VGAGVPRVVAFVAISAVAVVSWQRHQPFLWAVLLLVALGIATRPSYSRHDLLLSRRAHAAVGSGRDIRKTVIYGMPLVGI